MIVEVHIRIYFNTLIAKKLSIFSRFQFFVNKPFNYFHFPVNFNSDGITWTKASSLKVLVFHFEAISFVRKIAILKDTFFFTIRVEVNNTNQHISNAHFYDLHFECESGVVSNFLKKGEVGVRKVSIHLFQNFSIKTKVLNAFIFYPLKKSILLLCFFREHFVFGVTKIDAIIF